MGGQRRDATAHWIAIAMLTVSAVFLTRAAIIHDPGLRVPPLIAFVCAGVFLTGAIAILQQLAGGPTRGHGAAVLILAGLTTVGGWIALSPNSGGCTVGVDGAGAAAPGLVCRIPFGLGALITGLVTVASARAWIRFRTKEKTTTLSN